MDIKEFIRPNKRKQLIFGILFILFLSAYFLGLLIPARGCPPDRECRRSIQENIQTVLLWIFALPIMLIPNRSITIVPAILSIVLNLAYLYLLSCVIDAIVNRKPIK